MTTRIKSTHFSGSARVFDTGPGGLGAIARQLSQNVARIAATGVSALTDNSGGPSSNGTIPLIPAVVNAATPAALETALGQVRDGLSEIIAQCNTLHAKVPALDGTLTDSTGGGAADGTIAAITQTLSGVSTSYASANGLRTILVAYRNVIATLA